MFLRHTAADSCALNWEHKSQLNFHYSSQIFGIRKCVKGGLPNNII